MDLRVLQTEHRLWLKHNFPDQNPHDALLGVVEEVGELSHAHLKLQQGIRGAPDLLREAQADAIGDIVIYLASYCNTNDFNLAKCIENAWLEVKQRDWQKNPQDGT